MSILAELCDGTTRPLPLDTAATPTVSAFLAALHEALALPHPLAAYDVALQDAGGDPTVLGGEHGGAELADVGIVGCEERVAVRVKYEWVAREALRAAGVATEVEAQREVRAALEVGGEEGVRRLRQVRVAGLNTLVGELGDCMYHGDERGAALLLEAGADVDGAMGDCTLLTAATQLSALRIVEQLLALGADVDKKDKQGNTPLIWALNADPEDLDADGIHVIHRLFDHGADVNLPGQGGQTPLAVAAAIGRPDLLDALLSRGADVDAADGAGATPLIVAAADDALPCVRRLLENGADANAVTRSGESALWRAARSGFAAVSEVLLAHGADPGVAKGDGRTPREVAEDYYHRDVVALFQRHERETRRRVE